MKLSRATIVVVLTLLAALATTPGDLHAQGLTGQITGTIVDSAGGVLPGATVIVRNAGTNLVRDTLTGGDGSFIFPDLLAGTYDVKVALPGLKTFEQKGI